MNRISFVLVLVLFCFSSCSKEEISDEPNNPALPSEPALLKGNFLHSPVEGLIYRTSTKEGVTTSTGEFEYEEGEKVSFYVGSIKIGEAIGQEVLTPIDIASTPDPSIQTPEVKNITAFLHTLDGDKNPKNGITISSDVVDVLPVNEIDFKDPIVQILGELVFEINQETLADLKVVFPEKAAESLAQSLDLDFSFSGLEAGAFFDIVERWETRRRNVHWIHEFDSEGRITKSKAYQKYPWRPLLLYTYSDYDLNGYPRFFTGDHLFGDGSNAFTLNFYLAYGLNSEITSFGYSPSFMTDAHNLWEINQVDSKRRVTEYTTFDQGAPVARTVYEYNEENNTDRESIYDYGKTEPKSVNENFYTHFGSLAMVKSYYSSFTRVVNRYYRPNYSFEKEVRTEYRDSEPVLKEVDFIDENGHLYRTERYSDEFLFEVIESAEDRSSKTTIYNREDGSYYIEYRDTNRRKYKTEYYDSDGNLLSTEE